MRKLLSIGMVLLNVNAFASDKGNGGDSCSKNFASLGRAVFSVISQNEFYKQKINFDQLDYALNNATIAITERQLFDKNGGLVPALNNGKDQIYLNKAMWCESNFININNDASVVLHEYLGVSMPGSDFQYQLSGVLYTRTGLDNINFINYMYTGTDYRVKDIHLRHLNEINKEGLVLDSRSIKSFENVIGISEEYRKEIRVKTSCESAAPMLNIFSLYASYDNGKWKYLENFMGSYSFSNKNECKSLEKSSRLLSGGEELVVKLGIDSETVISFYLK